MSLLDVLRGVMLDPAEQAVYEADPGAYLRQYGYEDVDPTDLSEAFGLVADTLPADQALVAYSGDAGAAVSSIGEDTTDFDEPPAVPDEGGPAAVGVVDMSADDLDADDADDADADGLDDGDPGASADVTPLDGHFGEGHDAPDADLPDPDEPFEVDSFSWGDSDIGFGGADEADDLAVDIDGVDDDVAVGIGGGDLPPGGATAFADDGTDDGDLGDDDGDLGDLDDDPGAHDLGDVGDDPGELDVGSF